MSNKLIGVYGASGFGKEVMPLVRAQFTELNKEHFLLMTVRQIQI